MYYRIRLCSIINYYIRLIASSVNLWVIKKVFLFLFPFLNKNGILPFKLDTDQFA